jgi:hypothetical protein
MGTAVWCNRTSLTASAQAGRVSDCAFNTSLLKPKNDKVMPNSTNKGTILCLNRRVGQPGLSALERASHHLPLERHGELLRCRGQRASKHRCSLVLSDTQPCCETNQGSHRLLKGGESNRLTQSGYDPLSPAPEGGERQLKRVMAELQVKSKRSLQLTAVNDVGRVALPGYRKLSASRRTRLLAKVSLRHLSGIPLATQALVVLYVTCNGKCNEGDVQ